MVRGVEGWLTVKEGTLLYLLAASCKGDGEIVEIGSWYGKSTIWLANGAKKSGSKLHVYAVDPHTGSPETRRMFGRIWTFDTFRKNIKEAGVDDVVLPLVKTSAEAAASLGAPVGLVFIDGAHEYENVKQDFDLWYPKLKLGGVMAFHDSAFDGPRRVILESVCQSGAFKGIHLTDSIVWATKADSASVLDQIMNRVFWLRFASPDIARRLHLPAFVKAIGRKVVQRG